MKYDYFQFCKFAFGSEDVKIYLHLSLIAAEIGEVMDTYKELSIVLELPKDDFFFAEKEVKLSSLSLYIYM